MRKPISMVIGLLFVALMVGCSTNEGTKSIPTVSENPSLLSGEQITASYAPKFSELKFKGWLEEGAKKLLLSVEEVEVSGTVKSITEEGDIILVLDDGTEVQVKLGYRYKLFVSLGVIGTKIQEGMRISVKGDLMTIEVTKADGTVEKRKKLMAREVRDSEGKLLFVAPPDVEKIIITKSSIEISGTVAEILKDKKFILKADDKAYLVMTAKGLLDEEKLKEGIEVTVKGKLITHEYIVGEESLVLNTIIPTEIKAGDEVIYPIRPAKKGKIWWGFRGIR